MLGLFMLGLFMLGLFMLLISKVGIFLKATGSCSLGASGGLAKFQTFAPLLLVLS